MKTIFSNAMRHGLLLVLLAIALVPAVSRGQTSQYMSYQGFLTDGNGNALGGTNTGPKAYDVVFRIWDLGTAGNELFSELQTVTVDNGNFSVLLGQGTAYSGEPTLHVPLANVFSNSAAISRYVEMTVLGIGTGGSITILPRLQLVSSPFAFQAANALNITGTNSVNAANLSTNIGVWQTAGTNIYRTGGNIGINTATPNYPLDFGAANGDKISLWGTGTGSHYGFGIQSSLLQEYSGGDIAFGTGSSANFTQTMRLTAAGNLSVAGSISAGSFPGVPTLGGGNVYSSASSQTYGADYTGAGAFHYFGSSLDIYCAFGPYTDTGFTMHDTPTYSTASGGIGYTLNPGDFSADASHNDVTLRATAGKVLIQSGTGASALCVTTGNNVGIRTTSPGFALDVNGQINCASGYYMGVGGAAYVAWASTPNFGTSTGRPYGSITGPVLYGQNGGWLGASGTYSFLWMGNGDTQCRGAVYQGSDRNVKERITQITPKDVLAKVSALPISEWSYTNSPESRHIGPMAQDFRAAFNLGHDDKSIAVIDEEGVALAAIKGLNQKVEELEARETHLTELEQKAARVTALEEEVADLKKMMMKLAGESAADASPHNQ